MIEDYSRTFYGPPWKTYPRPFKSDGCSFIEPIYRGFGRVPPGREYCVEHDKEYWLGGTFAEFTASNLRLGMRMAEAGYPVLGFVRAVGVMLGGLPFLPLPWRWGFGRRYGDSWWFS